MKRLRSPRQCLVQAALRSQYLRRIAGRPHRGRLRSALFLARPDLRSGHPGRSKCRRAAQVQLAGRLHASPAALYLGFSLVEVIISLAILSIGVFGAMRVFPVGLRASQRSELISRASLLAERTMESLKLQAFEPTAWETLGDAPWPPEGPFEIRTIADLPSVEGLADPSRLKRLVVAVSWTQEGKARLLELVSYVRRPSS